MVNGKYSLEGMPAHWVCSVVELRSPEHSKKHRIFMCACNIPLYDQNVQINQALNLVSNGMQSFGSHCFQVEEDQAYHALDLTTILEGQSPA